MTKTLKFILTAVLILSLFVISLISCAQTNLTWSEGGEVVFKNEDVEISETLSESDFEAVQKILTDKTLYHNSPSCGFDENAAIIIDESSFYIAKDTCPVLYSANDDKYITLTEEENEQLREILAEYGFVFPSV